ncbi:hypothetical protein TGPRC2_312245 [Toxoplasma gondii TgCatPRC2]|uniref:Uncharacterized protein n=1 Tax=Toxoplasma gondii TgCatPRC2 TaxID=1130821 RepID=A0A151HKL2_TOXGO|nr:hypothetical protein TGPRC2_312245 [Toxoplasma gondii TgCatPRC2]
MHAVQLLRRQRVEGVRVGTAALSFALATLVHSAKQESWTDAAPPTWLSRDSKPFSLLPQCSRRQCGDSATQRRLGCKRPKKAVKKSWKTKIEQSRRNKGEKWREQLPAEKTRGGRQSRRPRQRRQRDRAGRREARRHCLCPSVGGALKVFQRGLRLPLGEFRFRFPPSCFLPVEFFASSFLVCQGQKEAATSGDQSERKPQVKGRSKMNFDSPLSPFSVLLPASLYRLGRPGETPSHAGDPSLASRRLSL